MSDASKKDQLYQLIRANPFISQQDLAVELRLSRSAVAGHIASLIRERRLLGRAYVLPDKRPVLCIGAANLDPWRAAGVAGIGVGGELYRPGYTAEQVGQRAAALVAAWNQQ